MNINLLKSKMILHNITSNDIAIATNVSKSAISQKMSGKHKFSIDDIKTLKELLHLELNEIDEIFLN